MTKGTSDVSRTAKRIVRDAIKTRTSELSEQGQVGEVVGRDGDQTLISAQGQQLRVRVYRAGDADIGCRRAILNVTESNMKAMYEKTPGGWNAKRKEKELFHRDARFVVLTDQDDKLAGFINWRFDMEACEADDPIARPGEEEIEVAYCYELQVRPDLHRAGLGGVMMAILERIASANRMRKVMLTVFTDNERAMRFYQRLGYTVDRISPSQYAHKDEEPYLADSLGRFEIMSKATTTTTHPHDLLHSAV